MDNRITKITINTLCTIAAITFLIVVSPLRGIGQDDTKSYELLPAPDVWYSSVDGVRVGGRLLGQVPGTFGDGPHRLNLGVWVGTKFPANPVSYYLQYTEPIPGISDFGSEGNISLETSYRTGFQQHGISFNKRWQTGFDEQNYKELSVGFRAEHRFDDDYLLYRQLWQNQWLYLAIASVDITNQNSLGRYYLSFSSAANVAGTQQNFIRGDVAFQQEVKLTDAFKIHSRIYTGMATGQTAPEYLFSHSLKSARLWMDKGLTRARGTIPPNWIGIGNIQITGGAGLRGYTKQDIRALNRGQLPLYTSLSAVNLEVDYPNPIDQAVSNIPVLGGFIDLRSYLFFDGGTSLGITDFEENRTLADAGLGFLFSINIPDYLGKSRGLAIRYDLPFWLSHPGAEKSFAFRNVIGIGAIISL